MSENPYEMSDKAAALLNRKAIRRFEQAKQKCDFLHIDELNVIKVITQLYRDLAADNEQAFLSLAVMAYEDAHGKKKPDKKWLTSVLESYDPVYLVVYTNEIDRKRDRLIEGVMASTSKSKEFKRGLSLWSRLTAHEADRITDEVTLKAYQDTGVKKVRWRTEEDEKVCSVCADRDRKIYPISSVPVKPHINCRCWLEGVQPNGLA